MGPFILWSIDVALIGERGLSASSKALETQKGRVWHNLPTIDHGAAYREYRKHTPMNDDCGEKTLSDRSKK